ncbi:G-type lectin S-receptor-like serine/threonine-protein kinase LECRK3, partial [Phalaenopsis equestris]|uniref:G-type lectin S-receptor-like serine/threonine-protein kinase LECRK3 n=1 Tax=Phalaenopsis equestris TaxID=78828 RepID=UPI0009E1F5CE
MAPSSSATLFPLLIPLFFILPLVSPSQSSPNITLGSSFSPQPNNTSIWALSPSGDFAFGFLQLESGMFLLAIWFSKLPENTVVWSANTNDNAAVVQEGSHAELRSSGRLSLLNNAGQEVWFADPGSNIVTNGALLDSGNLVLVSDSINHAWQSFDNPTDTILPTQSISQGGKLSSRLSSRPNDYSNGRFQLRLLPDGNLVLNTIGYPTELAYERYWISSNTYQVADDR